MTEPQLNNERLLLTAIKASQLLENKVKYSSVMFNKKGDALNHSLNIIKPTTPFDARICIVDCS